MTPTRVSLCLLLTLAVWAATGSANGQTPASSPAEVAVLSASALKPVLKDLAEDFRKESGHTVKFVTATAGEVEKRIAAGEAADVVIGTDVGIERMTGQGWLVAEGRAVIARVGVGVGVREGAAKLDLSSTDALRKTLIAAKSIAYPDPAKGGASGIHFAAVIDQLGIGDAIRAKSVLGSNPDLVCVSVAQGEAELCVHQISEIMPIKGVALAGPLPGGTQKVTTFTAALSARASRKEAGRQFLAFLARPALKARFAAAGLDYRP